MTTIRILFFLTLFTFYHLQWLYIQNIVKLAVYFLLAAFPYELVFCHQINTCAAPLQPTLQSVERDLIRWIVTALDRTQRSLQCQCHLPYLLSAFSSLVLHALHKHKILSYQWRPKIYVIRCGTSVGRRRLHPHWPLKRSGFVQHLMQILRPDWRMKTEHFQRWNQPCP